MSLTAAVRRRLRERTSLPRDVLVLGLIAFCVAVGFGVLVPVLPVFARSFGVGNTEVGAVISVFALMRLAVSPFCGRLIGWVGERTVLATGIFVVAASSGLAGAAQSYPQLLVLRGVGGIGSAMFTVSAMSLLLGSVAPQLRGRAAGFFQGGFLLGGMAGPAIGGLLALVSIRAPFFFYAGTLAVAGTVGLLLLSRTVRADGANAATGAAPVPFRTVVADPRFQAACLTNLAQGWTSFGVRSALIPVLVVEVLHHSTTWTGIAFACAAITQTIALAPAGKFVDTVGRRPAMIGGGLLAGVSIMVVPFAPGLPVLIIALCAYGIAAAFLGTAPAASVGDATGGARGTPVAVFSMFSDAGAIVGPIVAGVLADRFSYPWAFGLGAALLIIAAVYSTRMPGGLPVTTQQDRRPPTRWAVPSPTTRRRSCGDSDQKPEVSAMSPRPLAELVAPDWAVALEPVAPVVAGVGDFLRAEIAAGRSYLPAGDRVLRAFSRPLADVRILIVGQDPYPTPGHPVGLSFSVDRGVRPIPRSLANIYAELQTDLGIEPAAHGDLSAWFEQGVLLLNRVLTVAPGRSGSHRGKGWEQVTQCAIEALVARGGPLVAVLWGRDAQSLVPMLGSVPHVASPHPSPLSARSGFFGSQPFSRANQLLLEQGGEPVDWRLPA